MIPSAPRIQLIGAMFAPAQIQNCCDGVDVAIRRGDRLDAVLVELDGLRQLVAVLLHAVPPCRADESPGILRLSSDGDKFGSGRDASGAGEQTRRQRYVSGYRSGRR